MSDFTDDALGELTTAAEERPADAALATESEEIARIDSDPEDFDFGEFVAGARGARRAVKITQRADLIAEIDNLIQLASDPDITEERAAAALEQLDQLKREIWESKRTFVVRGLSAARRAEARKVAGTEPGKKDSPERHVRYAQFSMLCELAAGIVTPSGVTPDALSALYEEAPGEVDKLWLAFQDACKSEGGPSVNFSQRR